MVAVGGVAPADESDSSYKHQQRESYNGMSYPGLKAKISSFGTEIIRTDNMMTAAWLRLHFHDSMVHLHNNNQIFQDFDYLVEGIGSQVNIKSGTEWNPGKVWHGFNT